jgi:hypothetical protein
VVSTSASTFTFGRNSNILNGLQAPCRCVPKVLLDILLHAATIEHVENSIRIIPARGAVLPPLLFLYLLFMVVLPQLNQRGVVQNQSFAKCSSCKSFSLSHLILLIINGLRRPQSAGFT